MAIHLVLASASPRRKELLERMGFSVKVITAQIDETPIAEETPENYVKRMARAKVLSIVNRIQATIYPEPEAPPAPVSKRSSGAKDSRTRWIIGADTIVVKDTRIMQKPRDQNDALEMLTTLSGEEHSVITGFCIFDVFKNKEGIQAVKSVVKFKRLSKIEIEKYLAVGESLDKAGAYAVQGVGAYLVDWIQGSYTNIVGLPLCQVIEMMEEMGATDLLPF